MQFMEFPGGTAEAVTGLEAPYGACVISLDFELMWGVRERIEESNSYIANLTGARAAVPRLLSLFKEYEICATWAIVGFLFAENRSELEEFSPRLRPSYTDPALSPYLEKIGKDESVDPLHFGGSLVDRIASTPRQEIATHTFSHFYCAEKGQTAETFRADLEAARTIAARRGLELKSIVFPRNQHNPSYDDILLDMGIVAYRGNPMTYAWRFTAGSESRAVTRRALRFLDSYSNLSGETTTPWSAIPQPSGLADVKASLPLRSYSPRLPGLQALQLHRIKESLRIAAERGQVFHLWWHPHTVGLNLEQNLDFVRRVLEELSNLRQAENIRSMTMIDAARTAMELVRPQLRERPARDSRHP